MAHRLCGTNQPSRRGKGLDPAGYDEYTNAKDVWVGICNPAQDDAPDTEASTHVKPQRTGRVRSVHRLA